MSYTTEDGVTWAHLASLADPNDRYGKGDDEPAAGRRAMQRWLTEQEGSPPQERHLP